MKLNIYKVTTNNYIFLFQFFELSTKNLFSLTVPVFLLWREEESDFFEHMIRDCFYVIYFYKNKWSVIPTHL